MAGTDPRAALLELNGLLTAWIETEYHRRAHSETGQSPLARWDAGWMRLGRTPSMPTSDDLTEAFLWSEYRTVTKTATVLLHGNTYQVDAALVGRKVELVFSPFDMETVEVRHQDKRHGKALPHNITRHVHPKARPETPEPAVVPATGIDYLDADRSGPIINRSVPTGGSATTPSSATATLTIGVRSATTIAVRSQGS